MNTKRKVQAGTSLIEVLIAIVVLSVGLLAYVGLHAESLQFTKMAQYRSAATQLATDYVNRVQANSAAAIAGNYNVLDGYAPFGAQVAVPPCLDPVVCNPAELALIDQALWINNAMLALPGVDLYVSQDAAMPNGTQPFDLWVMWQDADNDSENEIGGDCPAAIGALPAGVRCLHYRFAI